MDIFFSRFALNYIIFYYYDYVPNIHTYTHICAIFFPFVAKQNIYYVNNTCLLNVQIITVVIADIGDNILYVFTLIYQQTVKHVV